jgi:hypothetical protein
MTTLEAPPPTRTDAVTAKPSALRYYGGWVCFVASFLMPVAAMIVSALIADKGLATMIGGALLVGGPEVMVVLAVALWGKETFNFFMTRLKKSVTPPARVSPARYRLGLAILVLSAFPGWVLSYLPQLVAGPARTYILAGSDFAFIASFFVLGGEFWGKLRALFTPPEESPPSPS